ncbi:MAG: class I SAM-dependent methyltransferase [Candidatus Heimdallarchaeaceae archaeon]
MIVQAIGVKIGYSYAEQARKWLNSQDLINHECSFLREKEHLIIPLNISEYEIDEKLREFPFSNLATISTFSFERKKLEPKNLTDALESIIPSDLHHLIPKSFDVIGNIAIVDIETELLPFKEEIGKKLFSLFPSIHTVYRKASAVSGERRIRELEYLAGEKECETIHKEYGVKIFVNVCEAYFSPRLGDEHNRVAKLVRAGETVVDLFSGIGSFPLHIAKNHKADVYAVDMNPIAIKCLKHSIKLNKLKGNIFPFLGDCRDIIESLPKADRVIMNLPGSSIEFLEVAKQLFKPNTVLHFYSFVPKEDAEKKIYDLLEKRLQKFGWQIKEKLQFQKVRESAPYEIHACLDVSVTSSQT